MKAPSNIDAEILKLYRELVTHATIAKILYITKGYVKRIINEKMTLKERLKIKKGISDRVRDRDFRKKTLKAEYVRNGVRNLWCNKGMRDKMEIAKLLMTSEYNVGKMVEELGI